MKRLTKRGLLDFDYSVESFARIESTDYHLEVLFAVLLQVCVKKKKKTMSIFLYGFLNERLQYARETLRALPAISVDVTKPDRP